MSIAILRLRSDLRDRIRQLTGVLPKYEARNTKYETNTKIKILMFKTVLTASEWGLKFWSLVF
jgi:hypothetical protein